MISNHTRGFAKPSPYQLSLTTLIMLFLSPRELSLKLKALRIITCFDKDNATKPSETIKVFSVNQVFYHLSVIASIYG